MTNITLYQAAADKQNAIMLCADEDGVLDAEKLALIEGTFEQKAVAYIAVEKTLDHTLNALDAQLTAITAEYTARINQLANNKERVRQALYDAMKATGTHKVQSDDGLLSATLSLACVEAIEIADETSIGAEWRKPPKKQADMPIDKTALKEAVKAGKPVPAGVHLVKRDRFVIR